MNKPEIMECSGLWRKRLLVFESLPSTNRWIMENSADCSNGDIIVALDQTSGRGRFDRTWTTPPGKCLTLSAVILPERENDPLLPCLCQAAALAVRQTIAKYNLPAMVKWPNDVIVNGKKTAGILAERDPSSGTVALGIGLNVNISIEEFSAINLLQPATSMSIEAGNTFDIDNIRTNLINALEHLIDDLWLNGLQNILKTWSEHDFLAVREIIVQTTDSQVVGRYYGLDKEARLVLADKNGKLHSFWSGDVSLSLV